MILLFGVGICEERVECGGSSVCVLMWGVWVSRVYEMVVFVVWGGSEIRV